VSIKVVSVEPKITIEAETTWTKNVRQLLAEPLIF